MLGAWLLGFAAYCTIFVVSASAQPVDETPAGKAVPALRDYAIDRWTSTQGLPHNTIRAIAQSAEGRMWFGTWEGVAGYDGMDFRILDRATEPAMLDNGIGALFADGNGLWIAD